MVFMIFGKYSRINTAEKMDSYTLNLESLALALRVTYSVKKFCNFGLKLAKTVHTSASVIETGDDYFQRMAGMTAYLNTAHFVLKRVLFVCLKIFQNFCNFGLTLASIATTMLVWLKGWRLFPTNGGYYSLPKYTIFCVSKSAIDRLKKNL